MANLIPNVQKNCFNYVTSNNVKPNVCAYFEVVGIVNHINRPNGNNIFLKVEYNDNGRKGIIFLENGALSDEKLMMRSILSQNLFIENQYAKLVATILTQQARNLAVNNFFTEFHHSKLGWYDINGQEHFLYDNSTVILGRPSICERKFDFTAGKQAEYEQLLTNTIFPRKELTLAYILGFSAVVVSRLHKLKIADLGMIVVNVSGKSTMGKSTMEEVMISPFGTPVFSKYALGLPHEGTLNGFLDALEGVHGLPRVIDDILQNNNINHTELLYTISQQESKIRSGEKWNQNTDGWSGLLVTTTESPLMEKLKVQQGTYPRLLNLKDVQWTSSSQEAEEIKRVVTQNYGFTGKEFIDYMKKIPADQLMQAYQCHLMQVKNMMTERDSLTDRIATRIAAIALTCNLVKHCFKGAFAWTMKQLIEPLIESEQETVQERNPAEKLLDILTTYVVEHKYQNFDTDEDKRGMGGEALRKSATQTKYGRITIYLSGEWEIVIHEKTLKRILHNEGFNEWGTASKTLIERGILIGTEEKKPNGKTTTRTRRKVGGVYCNVFKLKMEEAKFAEYMTEQQEIKAQTKQETVNEAPQIVAEPLVDTTVWNDQTLEEIFEMDGEANA